MSTPALTSQSQTLAQMVRGKYPGAYDDISDSVLEDKILAKYPQYGDLPRTANQIAPPGVPKPQVNMQGLNARGNPNLQPVSGALQPPSSYQGIPGTGRPNGPTGADIAAMGMGATLGGGAALAPAAARLALPFLGGVASKYPTTAKVVGSSAIHLARQIPYVGKFIPSYAELLPFLGPKGTAVAAGTDAVESAADKATAAKPPAPVSTQPEPSTPAPTDMTKLPWSQMLNKSLGNEPTQVQPGVPIGKQIPRPSTAVDSWRYDPEAQEFHVQPRGGSTGYIYGNVSSDDAQAFDAAESKGQAWQQMRNNPLVGKVINGKRVSVKPAGGQDQGNDLTDILTRSVQAAKSRQP